jgi:NCAIR mutase (PurE)-related protein
MRPQDLKSLARQLLAKEISIDEFVVAVSRSGTEEAKSARLPTATLDLDRRRRCGFDEVVFGEGKSAATLREILAALVERGQDVLVTRVAPAIAAELTPDFPNARYNELARTFRLPLAAALSKSAIHNPQSEIVLSHVALITAGTSDLPIAEEARETLDWMGVRVTTIHDVGVAGPHRLPERLVEFNDADAIVVIAGMEGALPSIVGGYVPCPVIAVPTSVGYGASLGGISALLSMLNSCANNVAVVNIDAGFKGAFLAGLIATQKHARESSNFGFRISDCGLSEIPQSEIRNPQSAQSKA